jgi:hypothetical protein
MEMMGMIWAVRIGMETKLRAITLSPSIPIVPFLTLFWHFVRNGKADSTTIFGPRRTRNEMTGG